MYRSLPVHPKHGLTVVIRSTTIGRERGGVKCGTTRRLCGHIRTGLTGGHRRGWFGMV